MVENYLLKIRDSLPKPMKIEIVSDIVLINLNKELVSF